MTKMCILHVARTLCAVAMLMVGAGAVLAEPQPIGSPNGTISGTIDGNAFDLPVRCETWSGALDASTHDQPISNNVSIGGVEPAINVIGFEAGFHFVAFIGGDHYKFIRTRESIEALPFTYEGNVRARKQGEIDVSFMLDCQAAWP